MTAAVASGCIDEPVSWLRLERYALGELSGAAAREVEAHVGACAACRACLTRIEGDARALPALAAAARPPQRVWWSPPRLAWAGAVVAATAIALMVVVAGHEGERGGGTPAGPRVAIKGLGVDAEAIVEVVRERDGVVTVGATEAAPGDRLKLQLTCAGAPPGTLVHVDVVVWQPAGAPPSFPLTPARVPCGNAAVIPGAFRLTADTPATVCVALDPTGALDRAALRRHGPRAPGVACLALD